MPAQQCPKSLLSRVRRHRLDWTSRNLNTTGLDLQPGFCHTQAVRTCLLLILLTLTDVSWALPHARSTGEAVSPSTQRVQVIPRQEASQPIFDIPVTYNARVRYWVTFYQTTGRSWFKTWLERSTIYLPMILELLKESHLPLDLAYVAMIESGYSPYAESHASAVGLWQFIPATGERYGLRRNSWLDERRDFYKSTRAAIAYKKDLYKMFQSWHLVAASYNAGENRIKRLIKRHQTNDFWRLADMKVLPEETINYVPKILAAVLIAKAPGLYGFRDLKYKPPLEFEFMEAPGGTNLRSLAQHLGASYATLKQLNPELLKEYIPRSVSSHRIRIPLGTSQLATQFLLAKNGTPL